MAPAGQPLSGTASGVDTDPDSATTIVIGARVGGVLMPILSVVHSCMLVLRSR
jgi:hypothetical protein